ncbi:ROK family transcriptional regulator [Mesorhizobium sp.]|uniref:ROK family transcriptional regulator n=1 Tax=Mesorhizobium sp. TaxID=1871066 RepID=UPI000FD37AB5|nr:ROK family transcriptional regulator [Mesorhizobium sp.]RUV93319.1 ROK family transcriptional regulator [Mesorhizobium sp. M5C.F.Ca.IN.020.14.1.1]RWC42775.1 MAG: ROK family transcriptional regulator [Mesorhizobium sp.]RWF02801.1 MAG: ROK family transcriptional regulator [Mesorhizobium sp.]RWG49272.1 MAG: ROK family transcriptional regulator [Mesorhizobium sp.]RWH49310.1 MAG: ROK family transcriptional regulator [Mesorhizobium sp.]
MALRGTNQEFGRPYNRRIVLESIRLHGPIARGDIARRVGLTVQTVSTIVRELEEHGYVLSMREEPRGRGLPPATLRINPEGGYAVGIHVTPLGINAALINLSGDVIESTYREAPNATPDHAFDLIGAMVLELTRLRPGGRVLGIGMALPGPFGVESMSFIGPTTMTGWKDVALRERLEASTGLPAFFETDMAAAAMGERLYGLGTGYSEYYYLYFGVGLGGVMVHDGSALRGAWGNAGEIGHIPVVPGGEPCPCGNRGCLERYLSLEALRRRNISDADWVDEVGPIFRNAITIIENLFDPETIILGGLASTDLLERLAGSVANLPNSISARKDRTAPRVTVARGGQHAVLRGAAALAVSGVLSPRFGQIFTAERERGRDILQGKGIAA